MTKRRPWPKKRRIAQAALCRKTRPEQFATGPRTPEGKAAASQNALKSGLHTAPIRALKDALSRQQKILRDLSNLDV